MLLFVENSELEAEQRESIREQVCQRLSDSWKGTRVDLHFVLGLIEDCPETLHANFELADRLAPLMTTARQIAGNPRLIKRFLNTSRYSAGHCPCPACRRRRGSFGKNVAF